MKDSKELKISEEAVLEASKKCPDAKGVLKALFPSVFKENKDITKGVTLSVHELNEGEYYFTIKHGGNYILNGAKGCKFMDEKFWIPFIVVGDYEVKVVAGNLKILRRAS